MSFVLEFQDFPTPSGPLRYAAVPWDTELLGCAVYQLDVRTTTEDALWEHLPAWLESLDASRDCLVVAKVPTRSISQMRALTGQQFYAIETQLDLRLNLPDYSPPVAWQDAGTRLRFAAASDANDLGTIASQSFSADRFHLDHNIQAGAADRRYSAWVHNAIGANEPVLILEETSGALIGFSHFRLASHDTADMSLGAIAPAYQATGAGMMLLDATLNECRRRGLQTTATKVSVNNTESVNLLISRGFFIHEAVTTLHWFRAA